MSPLAKVIVEAGHLRLVRGRTSAYSVSYALEEREQDALGQPAWRTTGLFLQEGTQSPVLYHELREGRAELVANQLLTLLLAQVEP